MSMSTDQFCWYPLITEQVLYWLSGLTCTDENFIAKSGAQRVASSEGIALVAPDTSPSKSEFHKKLIHKHSSLSVVIELDILLMFCAPLVRVIPDVGLAQLNQVIPS